MLKKACRECPFRRKSAPGYLGNCSHEPMKFIHEYWTGNMKPPCHMTIDYEDKDTRYLAHQMDNADVCFGFATICKNTAKLPYHPEVAQTVKTVKANHENFFSNLQEFIQHHSQRKS